MDDSFCKNCKHHFYYDWHNCSNEILTKIEAEKLPKGLKVDPYWGFLRIMDEKLSVECPYFENL